ncbi:hypothetical protein OU426_05060 [Frigidibacter sp. RF13]|uniref:hypothetical protein n=1 Tax=Frigidibacter sp. RF13 TaxID=2997340 RepID=UPI00226D6C7B|nr:hypothetical protein [Frigidibacter sp. RF13]MCY1126217.1 hypothetical protein [Frigidibacter sp. RF13]
MEPQAPRREMYPGDAVLDEDCTFAGVVGGDLTITPGRRVTLGGMVQGNLIVGEGAEVILRGMIGGEIVNLGGTLSGPGLVARG